jgi:hypothetical protein
MRFAFSLLLICFVINHIGAQNLTVESFQKNFQIHIAHTSTPLKVDGILDDSIWQVAEKKSDFFLKFPTDEGRPKRKTVVQIAYDDKYLYLAYTCYDSGKSQIQSLKRDVGHIDNDAVGFIVDPLNSRTTGFFFVVNSMNAQSEDQISANQDNDLTWSWNNKWFSGTHHYEDRWTAEMAIPFKSLRYPPGSIQWGTNFLRVDMKNNEYSGWTHVPTNFKIYNMAFTGSLLWDKPPPSAGQNRVVIPYISGNIEGDQENSIKTNAGLNVGLDSKIALNSSLNLDLTINPDFSQVEVDQQVTNLTRFNIFLPEKRSFFLENSDIFGEYGIPGFMTPFYSRKIGLDSNNNPIPIIGGARLSGSINKTTRIGIMDIQTGAKGNYSPENYAAVSVFKNLFGRSSIKGYFLDRENFQSDAQKKQNPLNAYGRNAGLTFEYGSLNGKWNGWLAYHLSMKPGIKGDNGYGETGFSYGGKKLSIMVDLVSIGTNYYTDMGYVQRILNYDAVRDTSIRVGFNHWFTNVTYRVYPTNSRLGRVTYKLENYLVLNPDYSFNENDLNFNIQSEYKNTSLYKIQVNHNELNLLYPISFTDKTPIPAKNYRYSNVVFHYFSDTRKILGYSFGFTAGQFYNGTIQSLTASFIFRSRPHFNLILQTEYDKLIFPNAYGITELLLLSPKIEYNFSTKTSWTTFLQYNTQGNNFNINSRFQYRFKPMSDLYIVYTDNYFTTPFMLNKNKAIVFKLNYWLNL